MKAANLAWLIAGALCLTAIPATANAQSAPVSSQRETEEWLGVITLARPELHDFATWTKAEEELAAAHFNYWKGLRDAGVVILAGRTLDLDANGNLAADALGLLIFRAANRAAAEAILAGDPGIRSGLWNSRLSNYHVALSRRLP